MIEQICQLPQWEHYSIILVVAIVQLFLHEFVRSLFGRKNNENS